MVAAQGGDRASVEKPGGMPRAPHVVTVPAETSGTITAVDCFRLGELVVRIGGGRRAKEDPIDPAVGLMMHARLGDRVAKGDRLAELHLAREDAAAGRETAASFTIAQTPVPAPELVLERIG